MYEARQNKEKVSRRIEALKNKKIQFFQMKRSSAVYPIICVIQRASKKDNLLKLLQGNKLKSHMQGEINKDADLVGGHIIALVNERWGNDNYICQNGENGFKVKTAKAKELFKGPDYKKHQRKDWIVKNGLHTIFQTNINSYDALINAISQSSAEEPVKPYGVAVVLPNGQYVVSRGDTVFPVN